MLCPHCRNEIAIIENMSACPICGEDIQLSVRNQLAAEDCVRRLITDEDRKRIEALLINGKRSDARRLVREIKGGMEALVEVRVLNIIEQTSSNELLRQRTQELATERNRNREYRLLTNCRACGRDISVKAETCPHCGNPTGVHVCTKCGSTNTKTISGVSKATSVFLWGPFAANKVVSKFQCKDCGHKF